MDANKKSIYCDGDVKVRKAGDPRKDHVEVFYTSDLTTALSSVLKTDKLKPNTEEQATILINKIINSPTMSTAVVNASRPCWTRYHNNLSISKRNCYVSTYVVPASLMNSRFYQNRNLNEITVEPESAGASMYKIYVGDTDDKSSSTLVSPKLRSDANTLVATGLRAVKIFAPNTKAKDEIKSIVDKAQVEFGNYQNLYEHADSIAALLRDNVKVSEYIEADKDSQVVVTPTDNDAVFNQGTNPSYHYRQYLETADNIICNQSLDIRKPEQREEAVTMFIGLITSIGGRMVEKLKNQEGDTYVLVRDQAKLTKMIVKLLMHRLYYIQNKEEINARTKEKRKVIKLEELQKLKAQRDATEAVPVEGMKSLKQLILSSVHDNDDNPPDADPILKSRVTALHGSMIDPRSDSWEKIDDKPYLIRNCNSPGRKEKLSKLGLHKLRDTDDNRNWFTVNLSGVYYHLSSHHKYRLKRGKTVYLHGVTANNLYHPAIKQFKIDTGKNTVIFPSLGYYCNLHHDVLPDFILEVKLTSDIIDTSSKMKVLWMNGKWIEDPLDAEDDDFVITNNGISHPLAPL